MADNQRRKHFEVEPLGDSALIVRLRDVKAAVAAKRRLDAAGVAGVTDSLSIYNSVGVFYDPAAIDCPGHVFSEIKDRIDAALRSSRRVARSAPAKTLDVGVCFDRAFGLDLPEVAAQAELPEAEVIRLYCQGKYQVACIGFTPGFPFLIGLPAALATPRRASPRKSVPAGSVAIGGPQTGIYPISSPGGWNIIGRTSVQLFDRNASPPALLQPGDEVRFHAVRREELGQYSTDSYSLENEPPPQRDLTVVRAGMLTTVQDLGRSGYQHSGVSVGGALDHHGLRIANLLVGNEENAAGLEVTYGGVRIRFENERYVAWTGGMFDVAIPAGRVARIPAGEELVFGQPRAGCRCWIAVSGGIDVPLVLGGRGTDLRAGFGGFNGRRLRDGDELSLGRQCRKFDLAGTISSWSAPLEWTQLGSEEPTLRVIRGTDWARFDQSSRFAFTSLHFDVTSDSNRMGIRLQGPKLERHDVGDLTSAAVAAGTVQVPPGGEPILLLQDCQTVGGYPKIAHVITVDLPVASQLRPGDRVRFREVSMPEAHDLLLRRERNVACFRVGIRLCTP